jgi:hypothetical protein
MGGSVNIQIDAIIQLVTLLALIASVLFGVIEIRRAAKIRAEKAALDVFDITVQRDIIDSFVLVLDLPLDCPPDHIRTSPDLRRACQLLMNLFEYWGTIVFYNIVPLRTLDLLVGGVVRGSWKRLHNYWDAEREIHNIPALAEWFQWLADRLDEYPQPEKQLGAHIAFSSWKP